MGDRLRVFRIASLTCAFALAVTGGCASSEAGRGDTETPGKKQSRTSGKVGAAISRSSRSGSWRWRRTLHDQARHRMTWRGIAAGIGAAAGVSLLGVGTAHAATFAEAASGGLASAFLFAFTAGLLTALTPCV